MAHDIKGKRVGQPTVYDTLEKALEAAAFLVGRGAWDDFETEKRADGKYNVYQLQLPTPGTFTSDPEAYKHAASIYPNLSPSELRRTVETYTDPGTGLLRLRNTEVKIKKPSGFYNTQFLAQAALESQGLSPEKYEVARDPSTGQWYIKDRAAPPAGVTKNPDEAKTLARQVTRSTGIEHEVAYDAGSQGYYVREAKPTPADISVQFTKDLGGGRTAHVLTNGAVLYGQEEDEVTEDDLEVFKTFRVGPDQELVYLKGGGTFTRSTTDPSPAKIEAIRVVPETGERFAIFTDGKVIALGKEELPPGDVSVARTITLRDNSQVVVLSDGTKVRVSAPEDPTPPAEVEYDQQVGRFKVTQPDGQVQFLDPEYQPGIFTTPQGFNLFQTREGQFQELGLPERPAAVETVGGLPYIRGTQGELVPLNNALDRTIEQAVIDGDFEKAVAFDNFKKRPSQAEYFNAVMDYVRSPADQALVSAIAHGDSLVEQGPAPGEIRRIGQPPAYAQEAFEALRGQMFAGVSPTPEEFQRALGQPTLEERLATEREARHQEQLDQQAGMFKEQLGQFKDLFSDFSSSQAEAISGMSSSQAEIISSLMESQSQSQSDLVTQMSNMMTTTFTPLVNTVANMGGTTTPTITTPTTPTNGIANGTSGTVPNGTGASPLPNGTGATQITGAIAEGGGTTPLPPPDPVSVLKQELATLLGDSAQADAIFGRWSSALAGGGFTAQGHVDALKRFLEEYKDIAAGNVSASATPAVAAEFPQYYSVGPTGAATLIGEPRGKYAPTPREREVERLRQLAASGGVDFTTLEGAEAVQHHEDTGLWPWEVEEPTGLVGKDPDEGASVDGTTSLGAIAAQGADTTKAEPTDIESFTGLRPTEFGGFVLPEPKDENLGAGGWLPTSIVESAGLKGITSRRTVAGEEAPSSVTGYFYTPEERSKRRAFHQAFDVAPTPTYGLRFAFDPDEFAQGGVAKGNNLEIVGEAGPELVDLAPGTRVIPLANLSPEDVKRLQKQGTRGYQTGGIVFGGLPLGLQQLQAGRPIRPPRGRLFRQAGLTVPSAQAMRHLLPEELEIFADLGAQAGIPKKAFERELALGIPSGGRYRGQAKFLPRSLRA